MSDAKSYREHGYLHDRGVFDEHEVADLRAALERLLVVAEGTEDDTNHAWATTRSRST